MTARDPRLPISAAALKAMVPGVQFSTGEIDEYLPEWGMVRLSAETFTSRDIRGLLRALHEGGHAMQHRRRTKLWALRDSTHAFRVAWALAWLLSFAAFFVAPWLGWALFGLGCAVTMANGLAIVACERQASEFAIGWLADEVGVTPSEEREARAYLTGLRRGYWRTVFGL